ncbi:F-box only protein 8-like [Haliotis rubra]|uniref:F-box only protein 8-like n=1 Tax=Haliotis rubra TaxID=36100 RepID=UPI001EE55FD2|nr:F-box only protein 8-like [Haliotis rubra]
MGQMLRRLHEVNQLDCAGVKRRSVLKCEGFPDLDSLPPELGLTVLSYLNPTDLCLASCVWGHLGNDEFLWQGLCKGQWGYTSVYRRARNIPDFSFKRLFLLLDEASLTFNGEPYEGMNYLFEHEILDDDPEEIARFLHTTKKIWPVRKRQFLDGRRDVLENLVKLQNFQGQFLPNALRKFFTEFSAPTQRGNYLTEVIEKFSQQFVACNPQIGLSQDTVFMLCFSLIMLSVDLASPHVKNKMSKREFIKNTCRAAGEVSNDLAGHLYDNIYLAGHVAPSSHCEV